MNMSDRRFINCMPLSDETPMYKNMPYRTGIGII
jgi:hypothetical protein